MSGIESYMPPAKKPGKRKKISREEFLSVLWAYMAKGKWYDAARILWPWFEHNPQSEMIFNELSENSECYLLGHSSGGKTMGMVAYAFLKWLFRPTETTVMICGPTLKSLNERAWAIQKKLCSQAKIPLYCDALESKHLVRFHDYAAPPDDPEKDLKSDEGRIVCVDGSTEGRDHRIRGVHTPYIIVLIDEGDSPNLQAVWDSLPNLMASSHFELKASTNPTDRNTPMGKKTEPIDGYGSIDIETDFAWGNKSGGRVVRLDALRSPNVVLGEKVFSFLPTTEWVEKIRKDDGEQSPTWFAQVRAWYPPDGMVNQIFSVQIVDRLFSNEKFFYADTIKIAALDPAYEDGADKCVLWIAEAGGDAADHTKTLIRVNQGYIIKRVNPLKLITEDRGDQVISILQASGVTGHHFCFDTTGNGLAVGDYIRAKWDRDALPIGFSAPVSERRVLEEDSKTADERFDRFVTELWFAGRDWVRAGHIFIHPDCMYKTELRIDLESRRYTQLPREKVRAETKREMRDRTVASPDFGDPFNMLIHLVRVRLAKHLPNAAGPRIETPKDPESYWKKLRHPERPKTAALLTARNPQYRRKS